MFEEIQRIVSEQSGVNLRQCNICGMTYKPRTSRQKTCGSPECRKAWNKISQKNTLAKKTPAQIEEYKQKHKEANKRWRKKQKRMVKYSDGLKISQEKFERLKHFDEVVEAHGLDYGEWQAKKTIESVPKIDVEGFLKEIKENKNVTKP